MASTFKPLYAGSTTTFTITVASLANTSYRQGAGVDNGTNLYQDAHLTGKFKTGASGVSSNGYIAVYFVGYDGTQYSNNASGSDAAFTVDLQGNLQPVAVLNAQANATTYYLPSVYLANAAGLLWLPQKWSLIVYNGTGAALDATAGNHVLEWQGMNLQSV
jgi:hypothetical protein